MNFEFPKCQFSSIKEIDRAVMKLLSGKLVVFPTETVYGLGADAEQPSAVKEIFKLKNRPIGHPIIIHISPEYDLSYWVDFVPKEAHLLIQKFWPGPLTLILKRSKYIHDLVTGNQNSIGIRCPSHPVAQALLRRFSKLKPNGQGGIAAPSANKFGRISPTQAIHIEQEFPIETRNGLSVLNGGNSQIGIESTIIDLSRLEEGIGPTLLRPGHITTSQISKVLGVSIKIRDNSAPKASGSFLVHYAPDTPIQLISDIQFLQKNISEKNLLKEKYALIAYSNEIKHLNSNIEFYKISKNPIFYAKEFYAMLRKIDNQNYSKIYLQIPPNNDISWDAINDRIHRAAAISIK